MFFFRWNEKKREWQWRLLPLAKVMNNCHFFGTLPFRKAAVAIPIVEHWTMITFTKDIWLMGRVPCVLTIWHHFYSNKLSKNIPTLHPHPHLVHRCIHDDQHSAVVVTPSTLFTMVSSLVETVEAAQRGGIEKGGARADGGEGKGPSTLRVEKTWVPLALLTEDRQKCS